VRNRYRRRVFTGIVRTSVERLDVPRLRVAGTVGSLAVACGGAVDELGLVCVYAGLTLLVVAWWRLGWLLQRSTEAVPLSALLRIVAFWAAPLLLGPPLFSRDVYSYLSQGAMVLLGLDIYSNGPASLFGTPFAAVAAEVPYIWQHTAAPYGPAFVLYATAIAHTVGSNVTAAVLGMRLVAILGVAALAWSLPWLARRCGGSPHIALWLGVLNPLVLAHLVAGAHNDAVMLGLLAFGLVAALAQRRIAASVLITLASLVKIPAVLGLAFVASVCRTSGAGSRHRGIRALLGTSVTAVLCALVVTGLAGTGFGWIQALGTPASPSNWSLTSGLARLTAHVLEALGVGVAADVMEFWRLVGLCVAGLIGLLAWWHRERLGPVRALGLCLGAVVVFGPAFRPWYLLWPVTILAVCALRTRPLLVMAGVCGVLTMVVLPNGFAPDLPDALRALVGVGVGLVALAAWAALPAAVAGHSKQAQVRRVSEVRT